MNRIIKILILLLLTISVVAYSQKPLSENEKETLIENIKVLIDSNYVFIDKVEAISNSLDSLNLTGKYNDIKDYKTFAKVLTNDLVAITKDKHFKVQYNPEFIKSNRERRRRHVKPENQEEPENPYAHSYLGTNYARKGHTEKAKYHYESILNAKNFSENWYTREAQNWLDMNNHNKQKSNENI